MSVKISIPGGNGRMGKTLIKEIIENESLELANSSCLPEEKEKGLDLGTLVGLNPIDKILTDNSSSIFQDTDVIIDFTVPVASNVLLKFTGERFFSSNASLNIFPGITIARYWSEATTFIPRQLTAVLANKPNVVFALLKRKFVIFLRAPIPSIDPPNIIALIVR